MYLTPGGLRITNGEKGLPQHGLNCIILKGAVDVIL
jgi:hypothetical protein